MKKTQTLSPLFLHLFVGLAACGFDPERMDNDDDMAASEESGGEDDSDADDESDSGNDDSNDDTTGADTDDDPTSDDDTTMGDDDTTTGDDDDTTTGDDDDTTTGDEPEPVCGNGMIEGTEACDDGEANADTAACTTACAVATCGDGLVLEGVEICDGDTEAALCADDCSDVIACNDAAAFDAGPIWNHDNAIEVCPGVCDEQGAVWDGAWWTTIPGEMSVCECAGLCCEDIAAREAGPLWDNDHALEVCPGLCEAQNGEWSGAWWTTIPGEMSVCECADVCA